MQSLRKVLLITFLSSNAATVIQFGVTVILARLMTPSEIGIFSITVVFMNIIGVFREFGVSGYLQREKELSRNKMRSALGLLIASSWILALAIYTASGFFASFYNQPGIQSILKVLTISFLLVPFANYFGALLIRNLEAKKQTIVTAISTVTYAITSIGLATLGFSYMSLAWANVANLTASIIVFIILKTKDIPLIPDYKNWGGPVKFGGGAILSNLIDRIQQALPDLILGKLSGPHDVGLYSRASGLVGIYQQVIGPTINFSALPILSRTYHSGEPLAPILLRAISYMTCVAWPVYIVTAIFSEPIIRVLYGEAWLGAAPIITFICIQAATQTTFSLTQQAMMAIGRPYVFAFVACLNIIIRILLIFMFEIKEAINFAAMFAVADILTIALPIWLLRVQFSIKIGDIISTILPSVKVSALCFAGAYSSHHFLYDKLPEYILLISAGLVICATWLIGVITFQHSIADALPNELKSFLGAQSR